MIDAGVISIVKLAAYTSDGIEHRKKRKRLFGCFIFRAERQVAGDGEAVACRP